MQVVKEALYDAFYKLTDSKSQVSGVLKFMPMTCWCLVLGICCYTCLVACGPNLRQINNEYTASLTSKTTRLLCVLQIRSYVFDVVRGTVPKINLDDVFTVGHLL